MAPIDRDTRLEDEVSPLLKRDNSEDDSKTDLPAAALPFSMAGFAQHWSTWKVAYISIAFLALMDTAVFVGIAAETRMLEDAICKRHFSKLPGTTNRLTEIPESLCKVDPVQKELAYIYGCRGIVESTFGAHSPSSCYIIQKLMLLC